MTENMGSFLQESPKPQSPIAKKLAEIRFDKKPAPRKITFKGKVEEMQAQKAEKQKAEDGKRREQERAEQARLAAELENKKPLIEKAEKMRWDFLKFYNWDYIANEIHAARANASAANLNKAKQLEKRYEELNLSIGQSVPENPETEKEQQDAWWREINDILEKTRDLK